MPWAHAFGAVSGRSSVSLRVLLLPLRARAHAFAAGGGGCSALPATGLRPLAPRFAAVWGMNLLCNKKKKQ